MGFYFSLYEWFNPLWLRKIRTSTCERHMFPQFKDLVTRYSPSVIFSDGEWELPPSKWHAPELLAWLYNDSPVADKVVVNDRWGKETRHTHGGYYTTEYGAGLPARRIAWEENRGIGHSYGYNRNENLDDYATGQRLLLTLLDTVSRGGNLLLNVGPTADGRIPWSCRTAGVPRPVAGEKTARRSMARARSATARSGPPAAARRWTPPLTTVRSTRRRGAHAASRAGRRAQGNTVHAQGRHRVRHPAAVSARCADDPRSRSREGCARQPARDNPDEPGLAKAQGWHRGFNAGPRCHPRCPSMVRRCSRSRASRCNRTSRPNKRHSRFRIAVLCSGGLATGAIRMSENYFATRATRRDVLAASAGVASLAMLGLSESAAAATLTTGATMDSIKTKDGRQHFLQGPGAEERAGPVFHHGWPLSSDDWDAQVLFFLLKGFRVIAHDRRGHGRSTQTFDGNEMDTYAADVAALTDASI
jgi:hypothetical protein